MIPAFLKYENNELKTVERVVEAGRVIKMPYQEEYPYENINFLSINT
jgi:hypothetical protein